MLFSKYNIIKGFLNLSIPDTYWLNFLEHHHDNEHFGQSNAQDKRVMVEYSSPNTNKPLHLGHLRNNFLGWSVAEILKENGYQVYKSCIVNDRGIHICKSMLAWQLWGCGETPENSDKKGDHLVGDYYVMFENALKRQAIDLIEAENRGDFEAYGSVEKERIIALQQEANKLEEPGLEDKAADRKTKINAELNEIRRAATPLMKQVKQMLLDWESGQPEVMALWSKMNGWVYEGFAITYKTIGSDFDKTYYESDTYLLGKEIVNDGLEKNIFYRQKDGSVWVDLTDVGLDEKLLLRKDGTSVYITQDLGLARQKYEEFKIDESIYVVGDEQNYHLKVLKEIAVKMEMPFAHDIHHLSYGMVELPSGKMKSREGTVVDADDIVAEMQAEAQQKNKSTG